MEPGHRRLFAAVERAAAAGRNDGDVEVLPGMCQGLCGGGVTLTLPDNTRCKAGDAREAAEIVTAAIARANLSAVANDANNVSEEELNEWRQ
jgi:NADH:ubiquinone oxidoreductase subunit E